MYLDELSRYRAAELIKGDDDSFTWTLPNFFEFTGEDEDIFYEVQPGDNWHLLAYKFYGREFGGANLWWAIMDYQPTPIVDPTIALSPGSVLVVPPPKRIQEFLLEPTVTDNIELI